MPIFEYTCSKCGNDFEALILSRENEGSARCPACGSGAISKRLSVFSPSVSGGGHAPRCETTGSCATPNLPGCQSGMCGL